MYSNISNYPKFALCSLPKKFWCTPPLQLWLIMCFYCIQNETNYLLAYGMSLAGKPVQHGGTAPHLARKWPKARSRTTWSRKASPYHVPDRGECRKKVRHQLRTARQRNSRSDAKLAIAVKNLPTEERRLRRSNKAVYRVSAGLPAHQPRNPLQFTGDIHLDNKLVMVSCLLCIFCYIILV